MVGHPADEAKGQEQGAKEAMITLKAIGGVVLAIVAALGRMFVATAASHKAEVLALGLFGYLALSVTQPDLVAVILLAFVCAFTGFKLGEAPPVQGGHT